MFKCIAYDENNKRKVVKLDLHSEEEDFHYASKNNLKIVDVKKRRKLFCRKKLKDKDLKVFSKQMCILLKSGCEISKILKILIEESNNKLKGILKQILSDIEKGKTIKEAFKIASSGRKGPVLIDIPKDLMLTEVDFNVDDYIPSNLEIPSKNEFDLKEEHDNEKKISEACKLIKESKRPIIYAGGGVKSANKERLLVDFAKKIENITPKFPVTSSK